MSAQEKAEVLDRVAARPEPKRRVLAEMDISKSTYYRWRKRTSLKDRPGGSHAPWNRLRPEEEQAVLEPAMERPDWSSRQLSAWLSDNKGII